MSFVGFNYKEQWVGTGDTSSYDFDFKIFDPSNLYIYVQDNLGNIVDEFDGTDTDWLSGVTFDSIDGGGTVNFINPFPNAYILTIFQANDLPDQPSEFPNKTSFTLEAIEGALDYLACELQRAAYLAQRSLRLHDLDDIDNFDIRLPINLSTYPSGILTVNAAGNGFSVGSSFADLVAEINAVQEAADEALAEAQAAATSATTASTAAAAAAAAAVTAENAAASALVLVEAAAATAIAEIDAAVAAAAFIVHTGPFASIAPNANLNLPGETTDETVSTMVEYTARIKRGTTVYAKQQFTIFYRNSAWEIAIGPDLYADAGADHGVTFTVNSSTGQINAAVANDGGSNAIIDLDKISWPL